MYIYAIQKIIINRFNLLTYLFIIEINKVIYHIFIYKNKN